MRCSIYCRKCGEVEVYTVDDDATSAPAVHHFFCHQECQHCGEHVHHFQSIGAWLKHFMSCQSFKADQAMRLMEQ